MHESVDGLFPIFVHLDSVDPLDIGFLTFASLRVLEYI